MAFVGNGWKKKVGDVYINQQYRFFYECNSNDCHAKFNSSQELQSHVLLKHSDMPNQSGAPVSAQFSERIHFVPVPFDLSQPPPPIRSSGAADLNNGRTNGNLFGIPVVSMPAQHFAAQNSNTQKSEVKKKEEHSRWPYKCSVCQKVFGNDRRLHEHKQTCLNKPFRCVYCKEKFGSKQGIYGHERKVHANILKYPCSECRQAFKTSTELDTHKRRIHTNPSIKCDFCPQKLCTQFGQDYHIQKEHSHRRYYCRLCTEYSADSASKIRKHYIDKHGGIPKHGI